MYYSRESRGAISERSVHQRVIFGTPVTTRAVARSPFDRFEKGKKVKTERRRRRRRRGENAGKMNRVPLMRNGTALRRRRPKTTTTHQMSWHEPFVRVTPIHFGLVPFKVLSLSLSPLTVVSARSVAQSTNSTHTHTNVISSWPPSKRAVPKRKQPDAIVQ